MFILTVTAAGLAAADKSGSTANAAEGGAQEDAATLQTLQESIAQQREFLGRQSDQIKRQEQQIREQNEQLRIFESQLQQLVAAQNGATGTASEKSGQLSAMESADRPTNLSGTGEASDTVAQQRVAAKNLREPEQPAGMEPEELPGYIHIPGTDVSMHIGGFVKMSLVQSFDPVGSVDRFVAGTIPVSGDEFRPDGQASLTSRQSRLNLDIRRSSDLGPLRAFMEGDFAGEGDTYRLRHAYGQFRDVLAGKTFSTFMDTEADPEEIDFEGLNGIINVRQPQLRFFPSIGDSLDLAVAVEDPSPDVTGGTGSTRVPDFVISISLSRWTHWHLKSALLLRQIRAFSDSVPDVEEKTNGWGISFSGRLNVPLWNAKDEFLFQLNYGDGIGRYINDLGSVGGQDAVFDPATGELKSLAAFGGYLAFQHWWSEKVRSTFVAGLTHVDNYEFQPDDAYRQTKRLTANLLFSPIPRLDIGGELLWGERTDKDSSKGDALQMQLAATYFF